MTNAEIKAKIAGLEKALAASTDEGRKKAYQAGIDKLKAQEPEIEATTQPKKMAKSAQKMARKKLVVKKKTETKKPDGKDEPKGASHKKEPEKKEQYKGDAKAKQLVETLGKRFDKSKEGPLKNKVVVKKKAESKDEPKVASPKDLSIEKGSKKESHKLDTSFDKDIKDAVLTLNKHRFVVREIKNKTTKKVEQVHHSPEYRNAKTIQARVEKIFDSSIYDIAKTKKEKTEKKEIIEVVHEIKDLHTLWLNEVDMIINNEVKADLEAIKKLMLGLIKEAKKNDPDDKWLKYGGLSEIAKKYNL
jgi:hypothetical protein